MQSFILKFLGSQVSSLLSNRAVKFLSSNSGIVKLVASKHWKLILIVILFAFILYQNIATKRWILWTDTIPYLENQLAIAESKLDVSFQANENLRIILDDINSKNVEWERVSKQLQNRTDRLQDNLITARKNNNDKVRSILQSPTPQSCEAAFDYLRDNILEVDFSDE